MPKSEPEAASSAAAADSPARNTRRAAAARRAAVPPPVPPPPPPAPPPPPPPPPALAYGEATTERLPTAPTPARPPRSALEADADSPNSPSSAGPVTRLLSRLRFSLGRRLHAAFFSVRAADDSAAGANAGVAEAAPEAVASNDDNDPPPVDGPCTLSPTAPAFLFPSKRCALLLSAPEGGSEDDTETRVEGALAAQKSPPRLVFKPDGGGAAQTLLLENVRFFAISDDEHRVQLLLLSPRGEGSPLEPFSFFFRVAASAAALAAALGDAMAWHDGFFDQELVLSTEGDGRAERPRGGGSRGDIYYGAWRAEAEERVAVKLARSPQVSLSEELRVMRALCPRVGLEDEAASLCIPLVGGYSTGRGPALLSLQQCIVTPRMWGGSLLECLHYRAREGGGLWLATPRDGREDEAQGVARRILAACRYMHAKGFVHDDIQPRSVLLEKRITFMRHGSVVDGGPDPLTLKNFGRAREASRAPHPISREAYASPERKAFAAAGAAAAAPPPGAAGDVWSIGVVLYEIMAQDLAAEGDGVRGAIQEGLDGPADEGPLERLVGPSRAALRQRGPRARELLRLLLQRDADERPSAEDALSHPWLTEADGGESDGDSRARVQRPSRRRVRQRTVPTASRTSAQPSSRTERWYGATPIAAITLLVQYTSSSSQQKSLSDPRGGESDDLYTKLTQEPVAEPMELNSQ